MRVETFITNFREAFGEKPELPIAFWYSEQPIASTTKINGCFLKGLSEVRTGGIMSLDGDVIGCGGGKFYTGFTPMPEHVPTFVSLKERYKRTPELVMDFIDRVGVPRASNNFLNFARVDKIENFDNIEGLLFLATPDTLSGLTTWTFFDRNDENAVQTLFGSGCCEIVTRAVLENKMGGHRTFLGLFDPSSRPHFAADILSFVIPMSRFRTMCDTMRESCLFDTHAWGKIKERING